MTDTSLNNKHPSFSRRVDNVRTGLDDNSPQSDVQTLANKAGAASFHPLSLLRRRRANHPPASCDGLIPQKRLNFLSASRPPQSPSMKFLWVVHAWFCASSKQSCVCAHLARCIINAQKLAGRTRMKLEREEEESAGPGETGWKRI